MVIIELYFGSFVFTHLADYAEKDQFRLKQIIRLEKVSVLGPF